MRWESVVALILLLAFWALSPWAFATYRDGGPYPWLDDLVRCLPCFVFCPVFAMSGLRHLSNTRTGWAVSKWVLGLWVVSPPTWQVLSRLIQLMG